MTTNIDTLPIWRDYYELTKPRVVMLIVFTAIVGMFVSVPGWPGVVPLHCRYTRHRSRLVFSSRL